MSRLNKNSSSTYGNVNTHIFTEFSTLAKETTQKEMLAAIKDINIDVGEIVVGDITVESNDTITHTKLDTINTTINSKHLNSTTDSIEIGSIADGLILTTSVNNFPTSTEVSNFPTSTEVSNFPTSTEVSNFPTAFEVSNFPTSTEVSNFPTSTEVSNFPTAFEVSNFPTSTEVSNFPTSTEVSNFPTSTEVSNFPTSTEVSNFPLVQEIAGAVQVDKIVEPITYDLNILGGQMYADSINGAIVDPYGRDGWYWTNNATTGGSNLYWYSNTVVPQNQMTKAQMDCIYIIVALDRVQPSIVRPFVPMYSLPTGSGDIIPGFAHSSWTYTIPTTNILNAGEVVMLTIGDHTKVEKIRPELRRVHLQLNSTNGSALDSEVIGFVSFNTDSGLKTLNGIQYLIQNAGFHYSVSDKIVQYEFNNSRKRLIEHNLAGGASSGSFSNIKVDVNTAGGQLTVNGSDDLQVYDSTLNNKINNNSTYPTAIDVAVLSDINISNTGFNVDNINDTPLITGFALDTTVQDTNTKLDTIHNDLDGLTFTGSDLDVVVSNTGFNVNNINDTPLITGFALDTTVQDTNTKLDTIHNDLDGLTFDGSSNLNVNIASGSISVSSVNIKDSAGNNLNSTSNALNTYLTNTSVDTHCYASSNGSTWHHLSSDTNGQLNIHSKTQDGNGTDITSTLNGAKQSLDVNVSNTVPVSGTFYPATQPVSGSVSVSNNTGYALDSSITTTNDKLTTTNSTLSTMSSTLTTIHNDLDGLTFDGFSSLNVNVANSSVPVSGTVSSNVRDTAGNTISSTSQSLHTYDYNINLATDLTGNSIRSLGVAKNGASYVSLTCDSNGYLNTTVKNGSTTNNIITGAGTGLNMYQILPKMKSLSMAGFNNNNVSDTILAGQGSTITINAYAWGKINANKSYWLYTPSGANARSISYSYINSSGDEATGTATGIVNSYVALQSNIVCLNNFTLTGGVSPVAADALYITLANSGTTTTAVASINGTRLNTNNTIFTVPNNSIAMITSIDAILSTANDFYYMHVWDENGNKTTVWAGNMYFNTMGNYRAGAGEYGCIGRVLLANETVAITTFSTSSVNKNVYANIKVIYF